MLFVEDERDIREVLRRYLERAGLSVLMTGTEAEAIRLLTTAPPDLVLLDLGLPDGTPLCKAARPHGTGFARSSVGTTGGTSSTPSRTT